jgi:hypothetical protein
MGLDLFDKAAWLRADRESPRSGKRDNGVEHRQSSGELKQITVSREQAYVDPTETTAVSTTAQLSKSIFREG